MTRAARFLSLFFVLAAASLITGCDPSPPSREELGRIVFSESEVPGADETYTLPERLRAITSEAKDEKGPPGE
jgi:hypothetical protein